jgi:hypothetical protein
VKTCTKCGIAKEPDDFPRSAKYRDGLSSNCRSCANAAYREWALRKQGRIIVASPRRGRPPGGKSTSPDEPPTPRPPRKPVLPPPISHKVDRLVGLLQAYGHATVWIYGETTLTVDGIAFEIGRKALLLGAQDIPFEVSAVETAIPQIATAIVCQSSPYLRGTADARLNTHHIITIRFYGSMICRFQCTPS